MATTGIKRTDSSTLVRGIANPVLPLAVPDKHGGLHTANTNHLSVK